MAGAVFKLLATSMGVSLLIFPCAAATPTEVKDGVRARLVSAIVATALSVPQGSVAASYEGQIAATIDRSGQSCSVVQAALVDARRREVPKPAYAALAALQATFSRCGVGTGAIGGFGSAAFAGGPSFSVSGGGSDYRQ